VLTYFLVLFFLSCKVQIGFKSRNSNPAITKAETEIKESKLATTTSKESMPANTTIKESKQLIRPFRHPDRELRRF
jgi:hypothetical protein